MPRAIDLNPQNLQVDHNPTIQLGMSASQASNFLTNLPAEVAAALEQAINQMLTEIDDATGLNLLKWAELLEGTYPGESDLLTNFTLAIQRDFAGIFSSLQQSWLNFQNFLNSLAQEADADVDAAIAWVQTQFNQLGASLQQSWLNFQNLLNGIVQETDADVASAIAWLQAVGAAANNAWTQIEAFIATGDWADLTTAWNDLLQGIFGSSSSLGLVGSIPAPAIVNVVQNLQPVWDFPDAASLAGAGTQWSWDGTEDHTGVTGSGSAKCVANGVLQALRGTPGAVSPAQVVTPTAWVMWSGLTAAGGTSPIQLELIPYSGAGSTLFAGTPVTVASVTSPGSSHAWEELTGTYTVPSSGVTAVQLRLVVTGAATAGSVWWDDCQADLSGGFLADLQSDTNNIIDSFAPGGTSGEFLTGVTNLLALFGLTPSDIGGATVIDTIWTTVVNDFLNPLNAIETQATNIIGDIEQSAVSGLTDAWDWLTGSSTPPTSSSTTQVQAAAVPAVGNQSNLLEAVQAGWDQLVQAFTGVNTTGHSLGQLANAASSTAGTASYAQMVAQSATLVQAQQTAAKAAYAAFGDVTADVTFEVGPTYNLSSMPTISVTAAKSAIGYIVTPDNVDKLSVLFVAETVGTVTGVYINVYSVGAAGLCTKAIAGSNIVSEIGTLEAVIYDDFPSALTVTPGSQWAVEAVVTGSGSLSMMGLGPSWAPTNSVVPLGTVGASRINPPTHDAAGAGSFTGTNSTSFPWSHTLGSSATGILIEFMTNQAVNSVKVGTTSATLLGSKTVTGSQVAYVYQLLSPPTGAQTVTVTLSASGTLGGNSDSYNGVSSFGTVATSSGASAGTASVSVSSSIGQTPAAVIFTFAGSVLSAFNQTSRWNNGNFSSGDYGVFGDAVGASSVNFQATAAGPWAAIGVSLVGSASPTPPSSFTPAASTSIPLFGLSANGGTSTPVFAPETTEYSAHGTYTYTLPTWFQSGVDYLDVIALGPGGGGGGGVADPGSAGSNTTVTVGGTTVTATAGAGAAAGNTNAAGAVGGGPGNETYNSQTYYGGSSSAYSYGLVTVGSSPGGGGAGGGTSGTYGHGGGAGSWATHTFNPTGTTASITVGAGGAASPFFGAESGADGAVWIVARQA